MKAHRQAAPVGAALLAAALAAAPALADGVVYTSHSPQTFRDNSYTLPRYSERVAPKSGHSLEISGGSVLASAGAAAEAISKGAVDAGVLVYNYMPSFIPTIALVGDMPGTVPQVSAGATTEMYLLTCESCIKEGIDRNLRVVINTSTEPYRFICAGDGVTTLADVKGKKIRSTGSMARIAQRLGGVPVNVSFAEVYEAMQRGQADCTLLGASNLKALQLWDVAKSVTADFAVGTIHSYGLLVINEELWESWTPEARRAWLDEAPEATVDSLRTALDETDQALASAKDKGVAVVSAGPDLRAALVEALEQQSADAVAAAKERGVADADAIAALWAKTYAKWQAIYEEIGADKPWGDAEWAAYQAKLKSEVYDKVSVD